MTLKCQELRTNEEKLTLQCQTLRDELQHIQQGKLMLQRLVEDLQHSLCEKTQLLSQETKTVEGVSAEIIKESRERKRIRLLNQDLESELAVLIERLRKETEERISYRGKCLRLMNEVIPRLEDELRQSHQKVIHHQVLKFIPPSGFFFRKILLLQCNFVGPVCRMFVVSSKSNED